MNVFLKFATEVTVGLLIIALIIAVLGVFAKL